jgi:hypothetical protein
MKKLVVSLLLTFVSIVIYNYFCVSIYAQHQTVIGTEIPWYSNSVKYILPDSNSQNFLSNLIEVVAIDEIDYSERLVFLNEDSVRINFGKSLNEMRAQYNQSPLKHNDSLSRIIKRTFENELPAEFPDTYYLLEPVLYQNIVMNFDNKEKAYCDYVIDLATMTDTDFFEMTDSSVSEYGFYFDDAVYEGAYAVIIVLK